MAVSSSLFYSYGFSSNISEGIEVIYSYNEKDPIVAYLNIAYNYQDSIDNLVSVPYGRRVAATQQILNNLPAWMEARKNYDSNAHKLVTAWGMTLEDTIELYDELRRDQFLATANQYNDVSLGISALSSNKDKIYTPTLNNLIFNSSFSMMSPSRLKKPLGWSVNRSTLDSLDFSTEHSLFGNHALILNSNIELKQTRQRQLPAGPLTYSIFLRTEDNGGDDELWTANEAGIVLYVEYADGSVDTFGIGFVKNTIGKWARASLTANLTKEVYKISTLIINRTATEYIVDCPLLTRTQSVDQWTSSIDDVPLNSNSPVRLVNGVQVLFSTLDNDPVRKLEVFPTGSEQEFKNSFIPTRIEQFSPENNTGNAFSMSYSRHINFFEDIMPTIYKAEDDSIAEKSITTADIFSRRYPADLIMDELGDLYLDKTLITDSDVQVKAVCVVGDMMYVITKETYAGQTNYYLKFIKAHVTDYAHNYVPSFGDIKIPLTLGTSFGINSSAEEINRIGLCKNLPGSIYIDTTLDRRFYFKLYYDYYFADFTTRKLFCRENYSNQLGNLQII